MANPENLIYFELLRGGSRRKGKIMVYTFGESITFTTPDGQTLTGVVEGRNWCFDVIMSYIVTVGGHVSYNVDAETLQSGHSF